MTDVNPYRPPAAELENRAGEGSEFEEIRRSHYRTERGIKSLGSLWWFFALLAGAAALMALATGGFVVGAGGLVATGICAAIGWGTRRLSSFLRWGHIIFFALVIFGGVLDAIEDSNTQHLGGTLLPIVFLFTLARPKAAMVCSPHYREKVIPATAHLRLARTSYWIVVFVVAAIAGTAIYWAGQR